MNIKEILPYLINCDMYVGNDTFAHHVTSQSGKPSIVILLNTPKAYTDYSKSYFRIIPNDTRIEDLNHNSKFNPDSIPVERVLNKILEIKSNLMIL